MDDAVIVVEKPAGLVTAPTPESDRGDLFDQLKRAHGEVYLVHRLDMPTSGLLVFARTRAANKLLGDAFVRHDIDREYRAVALGTVAAQTIDRPVGGRRAVTHVTPLEALGGESRELAGSTLLSVRLETGRGHQIRLHLAGLGHPIAGDHQHGGTAERTFIPKSPRLALHAAVLGFTHPASGTRIRFEAPLPAVSTRGSCGCADVGGRVHSGSERSNLGRRRRPWRQLARMLVGPITSRRVTPSSTPTRSNVGSNSGDWSFAHSTLR